MLNKNSAVLNRTKNERAIKKESTRRQIDKACDKYLTPGRLTLTVNRAKLAGNQSRPWNHHPAERQTSPGAAVWSCWFQMQELWSCSAKKAWNGISARNSTRAKKNKMQFEHCPVAAAPCLYGISFSQGVDQRVFVAMHAEAPCRLIEWAWLGGKTVFWRGPCCLGFSLQWRATPHNSPIFVGLFARFCPSWSP